MPTDKQDALVPIFKTIPVKNDAKSKKEGRPIYEDVEVCEIRFAADRNRTVVAPAHTVWKWEQSRDGTREEVTYAMRFPEQYKRFKEKTQQVAEGTPLEELPFLTQARRMELKALNVHTAEALASLEGQPLKNIGIGGRELKNQAMAYLEKARGTADVTAMAAQVTSLQSQLDEQRKLTAELTARVKQDAKAGKAA